MGNILSTCFSYETDFVKGVNFDVLKFLLRNEAHGEQNKRNHIEIDEWINDLFCFIIVGPVAKQEFWYMELYPKRRTLAREQMQKLKVVISVLIIAVFLDLQTVSEYLFVPSPITDECELKVTITFSTYTV